MTPSGTGFGALMLIAGIGIPIMAMLNSGLGARVENPAAAAFILFIVGAFASGIVLCFAGLPNRADLLATPGVYFGGGFFVAFYVLSITWAAPKIGVGNAVFFVLFGQLLSAAAIDHFGAFGAPQTTLTLKRVAGLALMAIGVFLARRPV